jgi:hypothetical protein
LELLFEEAPMQNRLLAIVVAALLTGCAAEPTASLSRAGTPAQSSPDFVSAVGTPFLILLKIPACVATAVIAGPLVGASTLFDGDGGRDSRYTARQTLNRTCGPPYEMSSD